MCHRISKPANADLDAIWRYVASDSIDAANRLDEQFHAAMRMLAWMPGLGHTRADVKDPRYRFWGVHSYVICYRVEKSTVIVARVVHGARDFRRLFPKKKGT